MYATLKKFIDTFHGNETIMWARLQLALGAIYVAMQGVDVSVFVTDKHLLQGYIFGNGLITELLRRRGATFTAADNQDSK